MECQQYFRVTRREAYAKFLRSEFWKELSARKRALVGECEVCGSKKRLQAHHVRYPKNWFDTTLEDLQVLCRFHHEVEHGITLPWFWDPNPEIEEFFFMVGDFLREIGRGRTLRKRAKKTLRRAFERFPESRIAWRVRNTLRMDAVIRYS